MRNPPLNPMTTDSNNDGLVDEYSIKLVTGTPTITATIDGGQKIHYDDISERVQVYVNRKSEISNYNWGVGNKLELNCKIKVDGTFYVCSKVYFYNSENEYITDEEVQSPWIPGSTSGEYVERSIGYDYLSIPTGAYYIEWGMFVDGYSGEDGSAWIKDIEIEAQNIRNDIKSINVDSSITTSKKKSYSKIASIDIDSSIETIEVEGAKTEIENATTSINVGSTITVSKKKTGNKISSINVDSDIVTSKIKKYNKISSIGVDSSIASSQKKNYSNSTSINIDGSVVIIKKQSFVNSISINVDDSITTSKKKSYSNISSINVDSDIVTSKIKNYNVTASINVDSSIISMTSKMIVENVTASINVDSSITLSKKQSFVKTASINVDSNIELSKKQSFVNISSINVDGSILTSKDIIQTKTTSIDVDSRVVSFIKKTETKISSIDISVTGSIVKKIKTITKILSIDIGTTITQSTSYGVENDVMWELQVAMYDELKENLTLMNLVENRLYDSVPTNEEYPYIKMGLCSANDDDTHGNEGYELTKTFHIYTKPYGLGFYTAMQIFEQLNSSLNCKSLSMTNYDMTICKLDNMFTETQKDKNVINAIYKVLCTAKV